MGLTVRGRCLMQVVLPLLQNEVVTTGWVSLPDFLTGLALVQAMPGPLFNFAAYLGRPSFSLLRTGSQPCIALWNVTLDMALGQLLHHELHPSMSPQH